MRLSDMQFWTKQERKKSFPDICGKDCSKMTCDKCKGSRRIAQRLNEESLAKVEKQLDIPLNNALVMFGEVEKKNNPNGTQRRIRVEGYVLLPPNLKNIFVAKNLNYCNIFFYDTWNVKALHIGGEITNTVLFRELKEEVSVEEFVKIMAEKGYQLTSEEVRRYTKPVTGYLRGIFIE